MVDPKVHLARAVKQHGLTGFARRLKIWPSYVHAVLNGLKPPSDRILEALGLERVHTIRYRRKRP